MLSGVLGSEETLRKLLLPVFFFPNKMLLKTPSISSKLFLFLGGVLTIPFVVLAAATSCGDDAGARAMKTAGVGNAGPLVVSQSEHH